MLPGFNGIAGFAGSSFNLAGISDMLWDFTDISTLYQTTDTSTPVTASGQTIGRVSDKSGNGRHGIQATAGSRPTYTESGGLKYAAFAVDLLSYATSIASLTDHRVYIGLKSAVQDYDVYLSGSGSQLIGVQQFSVTSSLFGVGGSASQLLDDASIANDASVLKPAIQDGSWHLYEARGLTFSAWTSGLNLGYYDGTYHMSNDFITKVAIIPTADAVTYHADIVADINASMGL